MDSSFYLDPIILEHMLQCVLAGAELEAVTGTRDRDQVIFEPSSPSVSCNSLIISFTHASE